MENISISTSQNINLEHSVASVGERIVAHMIDYLLFGSYGIVLSILIAIIGSQSIAMNIVFFLPIVFYDLVCELMLNGQNVGKRVMKLKVVMCDGSQPSFMSYFIRWIFRIVDNILLFGTGSILCIIITGRGQRIGDIAAKTMVIRLAKKGALMTPKTIRIPEDYQPVFPEAIHLTEKDFNIVREIIEFRFEKGLSPYTFEMMEKAKDQLAKKLHISSDLSGKDFLYTLEKDYVYYNRTSRE